MTPRALQLCPKEAYVAESPLPTTIKTQSQLGSSLSLEKQYILGGLHVLLAVLPPCSQTPKRYKLRKSICAPAPEHLYSLPSEHPAEQSLSSTWLRFCSLQRPSAKSFASGNAGVLVTDVC